MRLSDGYNIVTHRFIPAKKADIIGAVCIYHGMLEYAKKYDDFASALCNAGYVVYVPNLRGHGESAQNEDALGFLAEKDGFKRIVLDLREIIMRLKTDFPFKKTFLFAHSFGSLVSQRFLQEHSNLIDGAIFAGTSGPRFVQAHLALAITYFVRLFFGKKYRSKFLYNMAFIGVNSRFSKNEGKLAWISRDRELTKQLIHPVYSTFVPTVSFYIDLFTGLCTIHNKKNIKKVSIALPILLLYGTDDPIGSYGKTVKKLYNAYKNANLRDVSIKSYKDSRHELLKDFEKDAVTNDVLAWLSLHLNAKTSTFTNADENAPKQKTIAELMQEP